jgi:hypothetical protein
MVRSHDIAGFAAKATIIPLVLSQVLSGDAKMANFSSVGGTLAVIIPTRAGLIVAADKRTTPDGIYCDGVSKILLPKKEKPIAVVITGLASFRDTSGIPKSELCNVLATTPAPVDFGRQVALYIGSQSAGVARLDLQGVADAIYAEMQPFIAGGQFNKLFGTRLALVNMADFEPETSVSNIKSLAIELGPNGEFRLQPAYYGRFELTDLPGMVPLGEGPYLRENVLSGAGRKFLDGSFEELQSKSRVNEISAELGSAVAVNLIDATSKTTDIIKPPTGIGGGVDCILLGHENRIFR